MSDDADIVGYIAAERSDGVYLYACDEHTPMSRREAHLEVLRGEAREEGATCDECGLELAEVE